MKSIWQNEFYDNPPAISWLYYGNFNKLCNWEKLGFNNENSLLNDAIVSVSIPDRENSIETVYYGGLGFNHLSRTTNNGTVTITFNENKNYDISKCLEKLYSTYTYNYNDYINAEVQNDDNSIISPYRNKLSLTDNKSNETNKTEDIISEDFHNYFEIIILDYSYAYYNTKIEYDKHFKLKHRFEMCNLIKLDGYELSYESEETIRRTATFSYNFHKIITNTNEEENK